MHQDQRIGLALGVLLVGACAAFFFRNEARIAPETPRLQHAQQLDDRIAERSTRPYLKGIETVEASDRRRQADANQETSSWNPLVAFGGKKSSDDLAGPSKLSIPKPDDTSEVEELAPLTISDPSVGATDSNANVNENSKVEAHSPRDSNGHTAERTHVVQRGETLSSIATKTLGNPSRYHEIFEANQDQLSDPNDVKLGMILRIPSSHHEQATRTQPVRPRREPTRSNVVEPPAPIEPVADAVPLPDQAETIYRREEPVELPSVQPADPTPTYVQPYEPVVAPPEEPATHKRFVPAKRLPLPGQDFEPQTNKDRSKKAVGRRLSQVLTETGKVAR